MFITWFKRFICMHEYKYHKGDTWKCTKCGVMIDETKMFRG